MAKREIAGRLLCAFAFFVLLLLLSSYLGALVCLAPGR